jgi:hypothetical protein
MKIMLGFIPLLDCASLVAAAERGWVTSTRPTCSAP